MLADLFRRYFVANPACVLSIRRFRGMPCGFVRARCGNADGFFWGNWHVSWRMPWSRVWAFNGTCWVPAYTLKPETPHD